MSIKSTNIDFIQLPNPPLGYSYIGTDLLGVLTLKLSDGTIVQPAGVQNLSELLDVQLSGLTIGQILEWDGTDWVNTERYNNTQIDGMVSTLETQISSSIFDPTSLESQVDLIESQVENIDFSSIEDVISTETSERISGDLSLEGKINDLVDFDPTSIEGVISTETSNRISGDLSLETEIGNIPTFDPTSLEVVISTETSNRIENVQSLETEIDEIVPFFPTSLEAVISIETSERIEDVGSLETEIDGIIPFDPTSLEDIISTETSSRILGDSSLETNLISTTSSLETKIDSLDFDYIVEDITQNLEDGDFLVYSGGTISGTTSGGGITDYKDLQYNVVIGSTITSNGSTTINLDNVDIQKIHFDGDIDYDINISGSTIGKVLTLVLTNEDEDEVDIDFSSNCEVFGTYDSLMINAVSVVCIGNDEFWVTIANK